MNPVVETFICSEKGTSDQHYGTPTAVLVCEPNMHAGIGVLHLRGYPLLEMIEQGKKYKIPSRRSNEEVPGSATAVVRRWPDTG